MFGKIGKIALDIILSAILFLALAILIDWVTSLIFGTTTNTDGDEVVNFNGGALVLITTALTLVFSVWFYRFVTIKKK